MDTSIDPPWLNNEFLTKILQSVEGSKQEIHIIKFHCQAVSPSASNYLRYQMFQVRVEYKTTQPAGVKSISLIVKTPLIEAEQSNLLEEINGYKKEISVYKDILPKLYEFHNFQVTPKSYFCPLSDSLVLEDLKTKGYNMGDRLKQLDYQHCRHFLSSLAKLHALSVVAQQKRPKLIQNVGAHHLFNTQVPEKMQQKARQSVKNSLGALSETAETLSGCKRYAKTIQNMINSYWEDIVKLVKRQEGLKVLSHGDTWTANILFKYNNTGDIIDSKIVDFQMSHYCSFTFDIICFWWTSVKEEVREHHRDDMFKVYRQTLNRTILDLECSKTLSKEDFDHEMKVNAMYSLYIISQITALAMADPDHLVDHIKTELKDQCSTCLDSKYYKAILPKMLQHVEEFGAFEQ